MPDRVGINGCGLQFKVLDMNFFEVDGEAVPRYLVRAIQPEYAVGNPIWINVSETFLL